MSSQFKDGLYVYSFLVPDVRVGQVHDPSLHLPAPMVTVTDIPSLVYGVDDQTTRSTTSRGRTSPVYLSGRVTTVCETPKRSLPPSFKLINTIKRSKNLQPLTEFLKGLGAVRVVLCIPTVYVGNLQIKHSTQDLVLLLPPLSRYTGRPTQGRLNWTCGVSYSRCPTIPNESFRFCEKLVQF